MSLQKIAIVALGLFFIQLFPMKRANELEVWSNKRQKREIDKLLYESLEMGDFDSFKKNIQLGANVNASHKEGESLFLCALSEIDRLRWINVNSVCNEESIPLQKNVIDKNDARIDEIYKCLRLMLQHKEFNVKNLVNEYNNSALELFLYRNWDEIYSNDSEKILKSKDDQFILIDLLNKGACLGEYHKDFCPLHIVAMQEGSGGLANHLLSTERNLKTAELFIQRGADVNAQCQLGYTPLHLCANDVRMTALLLAHGAHFNVKNRTGKTPADLSRNPWVQNMLTKMGSEKCKNDIEKIIRTHLVFHSRKKTYNMSQLVTKKEIGHSLFSSNNVYPYTRAVLEYTQDCNVEDMMYAMGYEIGDSLISDNEYTDEESSSF